MRGLGIQTLFGPYWSQLHVHHVWAKSELVQASHHVLAEFVSLVLHLGALYLRVDGGDIVLRVALFLVDRGLRVELFHACTTQGHQLPFLLALIVERRTALMHVVGLYCAGL